MYYCQQVAPQTLSPGEQLAHYKLWEENISFISLVIVSV